MMGSYLPTSFFQSRSLPRFSYHSVGTDDPHEQPDGSKIEGLPTSPKMRRRLWFLYGIILATLLISGIYGCRVILQIGSKPKSFAPTLKTYPLVFELNDTFAAPPSETSNAAWDSLIPDGHGYVLIPGASERYGLKPGIRTENGPDRFSVAVYHQIHCLGMVRLVFYENLALLNKRAGIRKRQHEHTPTSQSLNSHEKTQSKAHNKFCNPEEDFDPTPISDHIEHCFDYLRQSLMCAGDMTIEHAREAPLGEKRSTTDGWGVEHQCKDWHEMVSWTLKHKANHSLSGILG